MHLDFHTSEHIADIGKDFSKAQFQQALKVGNINYINIFAKCHHGWAYYPTDAGNMHPELDFDLLGAQVEACHKIGVKCPFYFTMGLSEIDALQHPEWCVRQRDGSFLIRHDDDFFNAHPNDPKPESQWYVLCPNTGYHDLMMAQVKELCENYDVDGLWFDIYNTRTPCYCVECLADMKKLDIDINDLDAAIQFRAHVYKKHQTALSDLIKSYHPNAGIYFNGTTAIFTPQNFKYEMYEYNTFQDLEDLPTTSWCDYDRLPLQSKYFLNKGYSVTAMSGKFHKSWGEFGGFKHPKAILYEAASMISWGAHCNFGDQLHPCGEIDMDTYRNIGQAYEYVEKIEEYGIGGVPVARLAVWRSFNQKADEGLTKMLLESHINFDVANDIDDLSKFDVIIVPNAPCLTQENADRINRFVSNGGGLVVLGDGAFDHKGGNIILDIGADYIGKAQYDIDYLVLGDELNNGLVSSPFLNYEPAVRIRPYSNTEILATIREPYFSRTMEHFCGHKNTPYRLEAAEHPGIIKNGNVIFFAHNIGSIYFDHGAYLHRDVFFNAVNMLHDNPMITVELPSAGRVNLLHQADQKRYVAHLLYGPNIRRGCCDVIEDLPSLYNTPVRANLPEKIINIQLLPDMTALEWEKSGESIRLSVPHFSCHCCIVFEYE